jgi:hypothetical protein
LHELARQSQELGLGAFSALYDACVLHLAPIRNVVMRLALTDLYGAGWTNEPALSHAAHR